MASKFKAGDIVQLKSGGPAMTVAEETSSGNWVCKWFKGASQERGVFETEVLKVYEAPKKND